MKVNAKQINTAIEVLNNGGVIAYPTEAVWGLGCDPNSHAAVSRILAIKHRPEAKGLILVAACMSQLSALLTGVSANQLLALQATWPGPVTWIIEDPKNIIPQWIKGDFTSVAVRVSDHPMITALCEAHGGYLVSTSANPSGMSPATSEGSCRSYFGTKVDCYLSGSLGSCSTPSSIRVLKDGAIVR
ncbi:MAG: Sua5/YciO/YrdC/YwlC family protein [Pseudomonadales bacterium]|nr:Sua5/YciO/YrdC/YwlC family protein [Pseudomonadales bacterium]